MCANQLSVGRPLKSCPFTEDIRASSNTLFPGHTRGHNSSNISIGSSVFAGLTVASKRQTDTQTHNRLHLCTPCVRRGLKTCNAFSGVSIILGPGKLAQIDCNCTCISNDFYSALDSEAEYCDDHVCLSVCLRAFLQNCTSHLHQTFYACYLCP